jgi:hypothetical protein
MMRLIVLSLLALGLTPAHAGDRQLEVAVVRLDDGSDPQAKACFGRVRAAFAADYSVMVPLSRETFFKKLGIEAAADLLTWTHERLAPGIPATAEDRPFLDALVLVDCQPTAGQVRALVLSGTGNVGTPRANLVRFALHRTDKPAIGWLIKQLQMAAWLDFSP